MLVSIDNCKSKEKIKEILIDIQEIFNNHSLEEIKNSVVVNEWNTDPTRETYGNWNFSLYNKHWIVPDPPLFEKVSEKISQIPECFQSFINVMKPHSILPTHMDDESSEGNVGTLRCAGTKCYQISAGIKIPSVDPAVCGLKIGEDIITVGTGEIIVFDGTIPHSGWNKSEDWRITWILDVYKTDFTN